MTTDGPASLRDIYDLVRETSNDLRSDIKEVRDELNAKIDQLKDRVSASETDMGISMSTFRTNLQITTGNVERLLTRVGDLERFQQTDETRRATTQDQSDRFRDWRRHAGNLIAYFASAALGAGITLLGSGGIH